MRHRKTRRLIAELAALLALALGAAALLAPWARVRYLDAFAPVPIVDLRPQLLASDNTLYLRLRTIDRPAGQGTRSAEDYAEEYLARIRELPRRPLRAVVRIDCEGGTAASGIGAAYALHDLECPVTLLIDGKCYSSAMYVLAYASAQHVYITPGGRLMLHDPAYLITSREGAAAERLIMEQAAALARLTGQTEAQIRAWKDRETYFDARQAVEYGFCDSIVDVTYR